MEVKMSIKLVIGNKDGKTVQQELSEEQTASLIGKKINDKISGNELGFDGYEFEVTGGSDNSGTPMRDDVEGTGKHKVLCVLGTGVHKKRDGQKQRKTVCGSTISEAISQVNVKVVKAGKGPLGEAPEEEKKEGDAPAEEKKEEKPAEAPKEEKKEEAKPEEKPAAAEEKKEEEKKE